MMNKKRFMKIIGTFFSIKKINFFLIILSTISILLGVLYVIIPIYSILWDILGVIYLINLTLSIIFLYLTGRKLNKRSLLGNRINIMIYCYFISIIISMFAMMFGNIAIAFNYKIGYIENIGAFLAVWIGFFGVLIFEIVNSAMILRNSSNKTVWNQSKVSDKLDSIRSGKSKKILKPILQIIVLFLLLIVAYCSFVVLFQRTRLFLTIVTGMYIPEVALYIAFISLGVTAIFLKTIDNKRHKVIFYTITIIGLILSGICFMPSAMVPSTIYNAENEFVNVFGSNSYEEVDKYFLGTPFSLPQYFLGIPPIECKVIENRTYFIGSESSEEIDENITLCFDAYMPLNNGKDNEGNMLPGKNSTLIRIHGGGWQRFDKGFSNFIRMNRYFAAQGYIVFDIQYGLRYSKDGSKYNNLTPDYVFANFTLADMVRHIGNFTKYLAIHHAEYGANLNSTFISGGSAGGHLACVTALGITNETLISTFGSALTIKGLIPYYPGNHEDKASWFEIGGPIYINNPEHLVGVNSPPCLIYHGIEDNIISKEISQSLKDTYNNNGKENCAVIYFPLAGHANDMYFNSYLNLIFLYYMERFMYLHQ